MIAREEVKVAAHLVGQGLEWEKCTVESAEEVRYATDYEPPSTPNTLPSDPSLTMEILKNWPHVGITPTSFETRRIGQTLQLELRRTEDEKAVICEVKVHDVRLERYTKIDAGRLADGKTLFVEQPVFSDMFNNAHFLLRSGQPKLLGVHRLGGANQGMFEFFILTIALKPKVR
jgi:hypothetical protein